MLLLADDDGTLGGREGGGEGEGEGKREGGKGEGKGEGEKVPLSFIQCDVNPGLTFMWKCSSTIISLRDGWKKACFTLL